MFAVSLLKFFNPFTHLHEAFGSNQIRSSRFKLDQIRSIGPNREPKRKGSNWFKLDKIGPNWIKQDPFGYNWIKPDHTGSSRIKLVHIGFN